MSIDVCISYTSPARAGTLTNIVRECWVVVSISQLPLIHPLTYIAHSQR